MLQSRILRTNPVQALSHQSFIIRLNVRGQGPERLSLNLKLHLWWNKKNKTFTPADEILYETFAVDPIMCWDSIPEEPYCSDALINHTGVLSVWYAGYQCLCTSPAAWSILRRGGSYPLPWRVGKFIFLSRGHLMLHAMENDVAWMHSDNLPMKQVLEPSRLCRIISGQLAVALFELEARQEAKNRSCKIIHQ